jgi:hypothetical protein
MIAWSPNTYDDSLTAMRAFFIVLLVANVVNDNGTDAKHDATDSKNEFSAQTKLLLVHKVQAMLMNSSLLNIFHSIQKSIKTHLLVKYTHTTQAT